MSISFAAYIIATTCSEAVQIELRTLNLFLGGCGGRPHEVLEDADPRARARCQGKLRRRTPRSAHATDHPGLAEPAHVTTAISRETPAARRVRGTRDGCGARAIPARSE